MANTIKTVLIGIGDVASALVQGVENYKNNPDKILGLLPEIKQYKVSNIK
ncbi:MAG: hypothetical protein ACTSRT_11475 [Promethearchaeota archaeon]